MVAASGVPWRHVVEKSLSATMTSDWLVPSTRSEVIEDLVSGVGQSPSNVDIVVPILNSCQTDTILQILEFLRITFTTKSEVKNTIVWPTWPFSNCMSLGFSSYNSDTFL